LRDNALAAAVAAAAAAVMVAVIAVAAAVATAISGINTVALEHSRCCDFSTIQKSTAARLVNAIHSSAIRAACSEA
jgi:hypothetical protein